MSTSRNFKALLLLATSLLLLHTHAHAQSGRNPPPPKTVPALQPAPVATAADNTRYEKVRVVFARSKGGEPAREYRVVELLGRKSGKVRGVLPDAAVSELQRFLAKGFRVRDIFYAGGLQAVLERQAAATVPLTQTSER